MSRIDELIEELCPNGVRFSKVGDLTNVLRGRRLTKGDLTPEGKFPVFHGGLEPLGNYNKSNRSANTVMVINVGASAGTIGFCETDFWSSDGCFCLGNSELLNPKFVYYSLVSNEHYFQSKVRRAGIPTLDALVVEQFEIPVPPLPVQEEIVRILDTFTQLEAELEAELEARKKQYEHYRDTLLSQDKLTGCKQIDQLIEELCPNGVGFQKIRNVFQRLKGTPITATKMKEIASSEGNIRIFAGGKTVIDAKEETIPNANITRVPAVLVQSRGVIDVVFYEKPFTFKNEMWAYTADNKTSVKYLYYVLKSNIQTLRNAASGMGSMPQISLSVTEDMLIPVPPLPVQEEIVRILDRFDKLCNDISEGLPAEIEARRKQYEYYRDKLLTFKELKDE